MNRPEKTKRGSGSARLAQQIAQAAYDTKAQNIVILDLKKVGGFTDYFVIASGTSDRQVQAIADRITETLKKRSEPVRALSVEGRETGHWVLLDYGSVIAHVFYEESRLFYGLEKLWGDAPRIKPKLS